MDAITDAITHEMADLFCGAGGSTSGIYIAKECMDWALKMLAINHWQLAIDSHSTFHPGVEHRCADVESINPRDAVPGGRLAMLWGSPECTFFSNAYGGRPRNDQSRASAWQIVRWAEALYIERIVVENVPEFVNYGPLDETGQPIEKLKGKTYLAFLQALRSLGYHVQARVLCCADYGDATSRERLFILAHRKRKVFWPDPMYSQHGEATLFGQLPPWRTAREIIDWSQPGTSIIKRKRPLAKSTIAWIEQGLEKFCGQPFIIQMDQGGRVHSIDKPMVTITSADAFGVAEPFLVKYYRTGGARSVNAPLDTITTHDRFGLCVPEIEMQDGELRVDVRFRMLQPNELAAAMSLPYVPLGTRSDAVKQIGNGVPCYTAAALTIAQMAANRAEMDEGLRKLFTLQQERRELELVTTQ